ncbi:MAG TPA: OmpA family protein [Thermoanaerobaculia bacterium]|nr:OmpA family protein [Thermoanaerobaculia bacterium]
MMTTPMSSMSISDRLMLKAPTSSGETGLFTTITPGTLSRGTWSLGFYLNDYDLLAGRSNFVIPSARGNDRMGYDLYRLNASVGVGITDRWELSASLPYDRIKNGGNDRSGIINGHEYIGKFTDSGLGNLHIGTKFALGSTEGPVRYSLFGSVDVPTGDDDGGISTGDPNIGVGLSFGSERGTVAVGIKKTGDRDDASFATRRPNGTIFGTNTSRDVADELHIDLGWQTALSRFTHTNWINEVNGTFYTGGDAKPQNPIFLVTGIRHWFGDSGWALNAGVRWNVNKFREDREHCELTELDDCALGGLVGLTYAPFAIAQLAPPPPPVIPPPPPILEVQPPPPPPIVAPREIQTLRTDEIHFEPASARLTNIAKAILDDVALRMKQEPASTAVVVGYTDSREATGANADLDRRRAEAVRDYLVSRHGIDSSRITVETRGTSDAIGDNSTAEGRLRNRRVEIRLLLP